MNPDLKACFLTLGKFQSFFRQINIIYSFHLLTIEKIVVTCILGSLNLYIWMTWIWYPCNLPSNVEKSITFVLFIAETWYHDLGMSSLRWKLRGQSSNIMLSFRFILNLTYVNYFWTLIYRKPQRQFSLFFYKYWKQGHDNHPIKFW